MFGNQRQRRHDSRGERPIRLLLATLALTTFGGCGGGSRATSSDLGPVEIGDAYLSVSNRHSHDIDVGVRNEFQSETWLGSVRVHLRSDFGLPRTLNGTNVEILIRCQRTGEIHATRQFVWRAQERFQLTVPGLLTLANLSRR